MFKLDLEKTEEPAEKVMAPHSSTLAWKIPWTEELGRLQFMRSQSQTRLSDFTLFGNDGSSVLATYSQMVQGFFKKLFSLYFQLLNFVIVSRN